MSRLSLLDFKYNLGRKLPTKPFRWLSAKDRQISALGAPAFQPNPEEMRRVFNKIDADGDGKISWRELRQLLKSLGTNDADRKAKMIMWAADIDGDDSIGFKDFMEVHKKVSASDIRAAFQYLDLDGDGRIGAEDLHKVMARLGEPCTAEDCRRMVKCVDKSGNELVGMDDFMTMMTATMKPV